MGRTKSVSKTVAKQVKEASTKPVEPIKKELPKRMLHTGSTLLNLACADVAYGGWGSGRLVNVIGDSFTGKTILVLSALAEAANQKEFDKYELIHDDTENANTFDMNYMFGGKAAKRIKSFHSSLVEEFQDNLMDLFDAGKPFIYVLDSLDAIDTIPDLEKTEEEREARRKGKESKGSYGTAKAKGMSKLFRTIEADLAKNDSILIVVSQTRANIDPMSFEKVTRSGGKALKFYSTHEIWLGNAGRIKKKNEVIGNKVKVRITKNKITGKVREIEFPVYYDYGVDDIASMIGFLEEQDAIKKTGQKYDEITLGSETLTKITKSSLIDTIEEDLSNELYLGLVKLCANAWSEKEEALRLNRKRKYE